MTHFDRHWGASPAGPPKRPGFTLLELVVSASIAAILFVVMTSAILLGSRAIPDPQSPSLSSIRASQIANQLATELETALFITERSSTVLAFTVPDRNGDGIPERIRYAWSGTPGDPLTRQYNGGAAVTVADHVDLFSLTPTYQSVTETYPGVGVEDAADSLLVDYNTGSGLANFNIASNNWTGQYFSATLPAGATAWRPTRVKFMARKNSVPGVTLMQLRPVDVNLKPTATVLVQNTLSDSSLGATYAWYEFAFGQADRIAPTGAIALVLQWQSGANSATVQLNTGVGQLISTNSGAAWTYQSAVSLQAQLYAKLTRSGPSQYATSKYLLAMTIALRVGGSGNPTIQTMAQALNHPELLSGLWELKFDRSPTGVDVNGDGVFDWAVHGGGNLDPNSMSGGVWTTSAIQLDTAPGCDFANLTVVDVRFRNTTAGGSGAGFSMNAARSGSTCAPVLAYARLQADGTQTLTVYRKTSDAASEVLMRIPNLSSQFVDLHLIIDPVAASVGITVNNVQYGTFGYARFSSSDSSRVASIFASGSTGQFQYVRVRVMEPP